ncbi:MAG: TspO/MBR family protein [Minisyncoccota bacterium]
MRSWIRLVVSILASYGAGFLGSIFVQDGVRTWYATLEKPFFTPPDWVFAPVWFVLYGLMASALYIVWEKDPHASEMRGWVPLYFCHLLLNAAWSIFFFGFHALFIAFIEILFLFWCIVMLIVGARDIDRTAAWLLVPYSVWIAFAAILNGTIWLIN